MTDQTRLAWAPKARHWIATAVRPWLRHLRGPEARRAAIEMATEWRCRTFGAPNLFFLVSPRPYGRGYSMARLRRSCASAGTSRQVSQLYRYPMERVGV